MDAFRFGCWTCGKGYGTIDVLCTVLFVVAERATVLLMLRPFKWRSSSTRYRSRSSIASDFVSGRGSRRRQQRQDTTGDGGHGALAAAEAAVLFHFHITVPSKRSSSIR